MLSCCVAVTSSSNNSHPCSLYPSVLLNRFYLFFFFLEEGIKQIEIASLFFLSKIRWPGASAIIKGWIGERRSGSSFSLLVPSKRDRVPHFLSPTVNHVELKADISRVRGRNYRSCFKGAVTRVWNFRSILKYFSFSLSISILILLYHRFWSYK